MLKKYIKLFFVNLKSTWGNLPIILIPVLLTIPQILEYIKERNWLIWFTVIVFISGWIQSTINTVSTIKLREEMDTLKSEKETLLSNMESVPEGIVKRIFEHFEFGYNERITIYRQYNDESFVSIGRFALNEGLKKSRRSTYPKNSGFISESWNKGKCEIECLPDPENDLLSYLTQVSKISNMTKKDIKEIRMKSRSYYCENITSEMKPIAVIVFETKSEKFPVELAKIKEILESPIGKILKDSIEKNLPVGRGEKSE
ncbi:hypothetical protein [Bacillus cereus]|uniref:hypothetical protein n=1 Tax=Bacillus cereus TaxID=1396 RepID=UPI0001A061A4|nr:hypothetical protein [Bacillus cereus]EEK91924.1 hypothetical protein bcere0012_51290 [Bacillus cereus BDRD-ST24]MCD1205833.1 hypothetical protein [Bacillus cereus]HDR4548702.1 hypothetical protein [Bacillus cereus]